MADGLMIMNEVQLTDVRVVPDGDFWKVTPLWSGVDVPDNFSWQVPSERLARRLERAIRDGAVFGAAQRGTRVDGKSYAVTTWKDTILIGRYLNADLKRMGY